MTAELLFGAMVGMDDVSHFLSGSDDLIQRSEALLDVFVDGIAAGAGPTGQTTEGAHSLDRPRSDERRRCQLLLRVHGPQSDANEKNGATRGQLEYRLARSSPAGAYAATIASVMERAMSWWKATRMPGLFGFRLTAWKSRKPIANCTTER